MISIKSYITDNTNIIDIYLMHKNKENIIINDDLIKKININFKKLKLLNWLIIAEIIIIMYMIYRMTVNMYIQEN